MRMKRRAEWSGESVARVCGCGCACVTVHVSAVPMTALDEIQGYIGTNARISFIFRPEEGQSTWPKRWQDKLVFYTGTLENPTFSHDCASGEALTSCVHVCVILYSLL